MKKTNPAAQPRKKLPRPWNRVNLPVYSISSRGSRENMHIITYVSAVSMQPKRMLCAVYEGTCTLQNIRREREFVLQLLAEAQYPLVRLLGKTSGNEVDKISRLHKRKVPLQHWRGFTVLGDALALMHLRVIAELPGGDHHCFLCEVLAAVNQQAGHPLTLDELRNRGLIRI